MMIWTSGPTGHVYYVGPEWTKFTGQSYDDALGEGWLKALHPDDRNEVDETFVRACFETASFTIAYRLLRAQGGYARMVSGAAPSFSPVDGTFLGFLGSVTEVADAVQGLNARRMIGRLVLPPPVGSTAPLTMLDVLADQILLARATAERLGETELFAALSMLFSRFGTSVSRH